MGLYLEMQKVQSLNSVFLWLLVSYVFIALLGIIDVLTFNKLFRVNAKPKQIIKYLGITTVIKFIVVLLVPAPYHRILFMGCTLLFFKVIFNKPIEKCVVAEVVNLMCLIGIEFIVSKIATDVFVEVSSYKDGMYDYIYKIFFNSLVVLARSIILGVIYWRNLSIKINENLSKNNRIRICIIALAGSLVIFLNYVEIVIFINRLPYFVFLFNLFSMLIYFWISMRNFVELSTVKEQSDAIQNLENYNKTLNNMYDSIRSFRHDYANFVQSLYGYVQTNNMDGINKMCTSLFNDFKEVNRMGILNPDMINNAPIYSIVTQKFYTAKELGIDMNIEVFTTLEDIQNDIYEICRVLCILIDNAIDAAKQCENKKINICFSQENNKKIIKIENSLLNKKIDIGKIYEKGYTSKEDVDNKHGLGLWTVRKVLSKNKKLELFTTVNEMFCQKFEIMLDSSEKKKEVHI